MIEPKKKDIIKNMKNKIEDIGNYLEKFHNKNLDSCICEETFNFRNTLKEYEEVEEKYNEEFYFNCCCCEKYSCYCCCLNGKTKNNKEIKKEIDIINELKEEKINKNLENIETENNNESNGLIIWKKLVFFLFSLVHFYAISEIYSLQFAFFRELKRSLYRLFKEKYEINDQKIFEVYYTDSIKRDVSQINISYISSFFTCYLVKKYGILIIYLLSIFIIFIFMIVVSYVKFLSEDKINKNENYNGFTIFLIGFFYMLINIVIGIICFIPILFLSNNNNISNTLENQQNSKKEKDWLDNLIIILAITLSVIIKILIHKNINDISLLFSSFIFLFCSLVYFFFLFFQNKYLSNNDNQKNDKSENQEFDELKIINDSFIDIQKENNKNNEKEKYTLSYYLGYFIIEFEKIYISIKIEGFCSYICLFFTNKTLLMLLLINFFSRAQKIRFKLDFRKKLEGDDDHPENKIIIIFALNFIFSFAIYLIEAFVNKNEKNNNNNENNYSNLENNNKHLNNINNETSIIIYIIVANIFVYISSILHLSKQIKKYFRSKICDLSIAVTGSINYAFYIYYYKKKKLYIPLSAFFSISTLLLRICEMIESLQIYNIQIIFSIISISLSYIFMDIFIFKKESKKQFRIFFAIGVSLLSLLFFYFYLISSKEDENILENQKYFKCYEGSGIYHDENNFIFENDGNYTICVYGPKAKNGGKGGQVCANKYFKKNIELKMVYGGREAGGSGGKGCGRIKTRNGHNGAGYTKAYLEDDSFIIIAGGGGGNSESGNKGGDAEEDGYGIYFGRGAKGNDVGIGGDPNNMNERGSELKGGNGESDKSLGKYCGGGGGSGFRGGGAGHFGNEKEDGGGGGGSNYCKPDNCEKKINEKYFLSCIEIIEIKKQIN